MAELESERELTPHALSRALRRRLDIDDVAAWIRFDAGNYARRLIAKTERWELRLLCWQSEQSSSLHGHGGAACAFRVLRGSATETVLGKRDRTLGPGEVVQEGDDLVHQVANRERDPLITLHAYAPPLPVDAPSPRLGHEVVVIGGGFSGAAVAYHLLRRAAPDLRISLIERGPWVGRGIAYAVDSRRFRLNVPASKMSIDPERPLDFVEWACSGHDPDAFLPRALYAEYVTARLADAVRSSPGKLRLVRSDAVAARDRSVELADGRVLDADAIVLATGLAPRMAPQHLASDPRVIDAWDECAIATLPGDGHILVLGSGLTALDVIGILHSRRYAGRLTIVSRHGLLPLAHLEPFVPAPPLPAAVAASAPRALRPLIRWTRALVEEAQARGEPWQLAIDSLRPHIHSLWRALPVEDRIRFVRKLRPYWDVLRHRAPADALRLVDDWRSRGRLERIAGQVAACRVRPAGLDVTVRCRGGGTKQLRVDAIVRCVGPALERAETENPIMASLIAGGIAKPDATGLGLTSDGEGRVLRPDGGPCDGLFVIGALRRPAEWESTAVPDIARHAAALAVQLLG